MKKQNRLLKIRAVIYVVIFACVAILLETAILSYTNKIHVGRTSRIILEQVERILREHSENEAEILASLKVEYVDKAQAVTYMLNVGDVDPTDCEELEKICGLMDIDEIHIFDKNGVICGGSVPKYYGISFDDGKQVSFFKPMLLDKNLTMCQDMTPNTAEAKPMMYAITWDETGSYMLQVGVEPVRLLEVLKRNDLKEVVRQMPVYDGMEIYVIDAESGKILGATDQDKVGLSAYHEDFLSAHDKVSELTSRSIRMNGYTHYCDYKMVDEYLVVTVHSTSVNVDSFVISVVIELVWILLAGIVIVFVIFKLVRANYQVHEQMAILKSMSEIYYSMHLIDLSDYSIVPLEANELMTKVVEEGENAKDMLEKIVEMTLVDECKKAASEFLDLSTLQERLSRKKSDTMDALDKNVGWLRIVFIAESTDENGVPVKAIIATQIIDEEKRREEELSFKANRDELTGLYNRRAYENDVMIYPDVPPEPDFVYAAIDINGLKVVNDSIGHAAGDELIVGAAECLKRALGNYGRVYRTGGDEFVAMFFADEARFQEITRDLQAVTAAWSGTQVDSLSMSVGYATKREFSTETVVEMGKIADQRMYKDKAQYYSQKGIDRRGQAAAYKALCNLYTKILKINITLDTYSIVNMDSGEKTEDKGFSDKISEWLKGFGTSGQVHEEDLPFYLKKTDINYLRDYFKGNKTSISIYYRRKYADGFKHVVMDMIPADDYAEDNQSLFLYVKSLDK